MIEKILRDYRGMSYQVRTIWSWRFHSETAEISQTLMCANARVEKYERKTEIEMH